jgi:hypothetical protein
LVATPPDLSYPFATTFDVHANEVIVSTVTSESLGYWSFIRDLPSGRTVRATASPTADGAGALEGPAVQASDAGFLFNRNMYGPSGSTQGVVLRSLTGVETFAETNLVPSSNGWLTTSLGLGGYYAQTGVCRFPCADVVRFDFGPTVWEGQVSSAVAGTKVLVVQASPYIGSPYTVLQRQPNRLAVFDRTDPSAPPIVLMESSGTFSQLRAEGTDIVFSLRRYVAGVDVSTVYAYSATTGKLRNVTP